jgi:hypothetical protein
VPEYVLPFRIQRTLLVLNAVVNTIAAACCGGLFAFVIQHDGLLALKVSACLTAVGYRLRVIPYRDLTILIRTELAQDDGP